MKSNPLPVTFQTLPLEIRYIIYSLILPQRRLIHLTGQDEQAPYILTSIGHMQADSSGS
jgi:hypothetical protein